MKTFFKYSVIIFNIIFGCSDPFSTPEATIHYYHQSLEKKDLQAVNSCFIDGNFSPNSLGKYWVEYTIKEVKSYDSQAIEEFKKSLKSEYLPDRDPIIGDVGIIVTKKIKMKKNNQIKEFQYWYLLRKINGKWLIISHYGMNNQD